MSDDRFFQADGPFALGQLARLTGAELSCQDRTNELASDVAELEQAVTGEVSLFSSARHADAFAKSHASLIVTSRKLSGFPHNGCALLLTDDPRQAFAHICRLFYPRETPANFTHPSATIAASARIGDDTTIAAGAVIGENVTIGPRCHIGANVVIGDGVSLGAEVTVGANSSISHALIGDRVNIAFHVSIGGEGFGFVAGPDGPMRMAQIGRVIIGDGVDIGSNTAIDRGCLGDTMIGAMTALDNLVQIAHNVKIGRGCVMAGQSGIAGSTTLGDFVMVGGGVSISDHLTIGSGAKIAARSGVMRNVAAGEVIAGSPAVPVRQWHRQTLALWKLAAKINGKCES